MNAKTLKQRRNVKLLQRKKNALGNMENVENKQKFVHLLVI